MATKYFLTDDAWLNLGALPAKFTNNTPYLIYYIISDLAPGSLAEAHSILYSETKTLTGTGTQRLYARLGSPTAGVFATRDGENIFANRNDNVVTLPGVTIEDIVAAFKEAIDDIDTLNIVDPIPTFAVNNAAGTEAYIGFKGERGTKNDVYLLWNEADSRWGFYETYDNNNLGSRLKTNVEFGTAYGALSGNATTASRLEFARSITLAGDMDGTNSFNGSANISITVTLKTLPGLTAGSYTKVTVNTKGQVTAATQLGSSDVTTALGFTPYGPNDATAAATANKLALRNASGDIAFNVVGATQFNGPLSGNAATATKLQTARLINGRSFDGTADIAMNTADVAEMTNLYFTTARARGALSGTGGIDYNPTTGVIQLSSGGAPVTSVAGRTGAVTLTTADIASLDSALTARPVARISPTTLADNTTIPNTSSGVMFRMLCGTGDMRFNLPVTSGLPDGWHCYVLAEGITTYLKSQVKTTDSKNIEYRGYTNTIFYMLGKGEVFRFTWFSGLNGGSGIWQAECVKQPKLIRVYRALTGSSWNSSPPSFTAMSFNSLVGNPDPGDTVAFSSASQYVRLPCIGQWYHRYSCQYSASAGGGVSGFAYLAPTQVQTLGPDSNVDYEYRNYVANEDGAMATTKWVAINQETDLSAALQLAGDVNVWYFPASNAAHVALLSR